MSRRALALPSTKSAEPDDADELEAGAEEEPATGEREAHAHPWAARTRRQLLAGRVITPQSLPVDALLRVR